MPYLILDALREGARHNGAIRSQAVVIAIGVAWDGRRPILGVQLAGRESRSSGKAFLSGLRERLYTASRCSSATTTGLTRARREVLSEAA